MRARINTIVPRRLLSCERGATAVEYGLILALIFLAMAAALTNVAEQTIGMWNHVTTEVNAN